MYPLLLFDMADTITAVGEKKRQGADLCQKDTYDILHYLDIYICTKIHSSLKV